MATGNFVLDKGYNAAVAITKFRAVKFSAAETVTPVSGIADRVVGFAQFGCTTAEVAKNKGTSVRMLGITEAEASAAIAVGDLVEVIADGRVRTATASSAARIVGMCVGHAAAAAGDRISLLLSPGGGLVGATF